MSRGAVPARPGMVGFGETGTTGRSAFGVPVNSATAMRHVAVMACLSILAADVPGFYSTCTTLCRAAAKRRRRITSCTARCANGTTGRSGCGSRRWCWRRWVGPRPVRPRRGSSPGWGPRVARPRRGGGRLHDAQQVGVGCLQTRTKRPTPPRKRQRRSRRHRNTRARASEARGNTLRRER